MLNPSLRMVQGLYPLFRPLVRSRVDFDLFAQGVVPLVAFIDVVSRVNDGFGPQTGVPAWVTGVYTI